MIDQFDRLRRRNAFVEQYKKEKIFADGLEEFDDARCVARSSLLARRVLSGVLGSPFCFIRSATAEELLKEYKACESPDYITYVRPFVPPFSELAHSSSYAIPLLACDIGRPQLIVDCPHTGIW